MKKFVFLLSLMVLSSCQKKVDQPEEVEEEMHTKAPYDTAAVDSFSSGATTVNIARQIKMSSQRYQDSLKTVRKKMEEERTLKQAQEKAEKEKAEAKSAEEKKKADAAKVTPEPAKTRAAGGAQ